MKASSQVNYTPLLIIGLLMLLVISGCSNYEEVTECLEGEKYRFLNGLWHGIIAPIDLVAMIWRDDVTVYAPNNNGFWYAFGFVLGSGGWGFMGGKGASSSRRRRREER